MECNALQAINALQQDHAVFHLIKIQEIPLFRRMKQQLYMFVGQMGQKQVLDKRLQLILKLQPLT